MKANRGMRLNRTPKRLRTRGQTDNHKCRHIKAKRVQVGMQRISKAGPELIVDVRVCGGGVSIYTDRYPGGLYYGRNSLVPVR